MCFGHPRIDFQMACAQRHGTLGLRPAGPSAGPCVSRRYVHHICPGCELFLLFFLERERIWPMIRGTVQGVRRHKEVPTQGSRLPLCAGHSARRAGIPLRHGRQQPCLPAHGLCGVRLGGTFNSHGQVRGGFQPPCCSSPFVDPCVGSAGSFNARFGYDLSLSDSLSLSLSLSLSCCVCAMVVCLVRVFVCLALIWSGLFVRSFVCLGVHECVCVWFCRGPFFFLELYNISLL